MNKKKVRIIDYLMFPLFCISFIIGYLWQTIQAGFASAEYYFDPESFKRRFGE